MNKAMEKVKGKYGDIPLTYVQMFGDLFCDLRVHPQWSVPELAVVSSAVCGAFITKVQNPNHPISTAEIRKEAIDSIEQGPRVFIFTSAMRKQGSPLGI